MEGIAINGVTLDGVMQGPGRPDEDTRDGFVHGGWGIPYYDEATVAKMGERMEGNARGRSGGAPTRRCWPPGNALRRSVQGRAQRRSQVRRLEQPHNEARVAELDSAARGRSGRRGGAQGEFLAPTS